MGTQKENKIFRAVFFFFSYFLKFYITLRFENGFVVG